MKKSKYTHPKSMRGKAEHLAQKIAIPPVVKSTASSAAALSKLATKVVDVGQGAQVGNGLNTPDGWKINLGGNQTASDPLKTQAALASQANDPAAEQEDDADDRADATQDDNEESGDNAEASNRPRPPAEWSDDAKAHFGDLPGVVQDAIAQHTKTMTDKISSHKQLLINQSEQVNTTLSAVLEHLAEIDPIVSHGMVTDWAELAKSDPQAHGSKWPQFQQRMAMLNGLAAQRNAAKQMQQTKQSELTRQALVSKLPDWHDEVKRAQMVDLLKRHAGHWGYNPEDMGQVKDHRMVLMALDAAKFRDQQKAVQNLPTKRVGNLPQTLPASLKPASGQKSARTGTLDQQKIEALRSGSLRKQADYIMRVLQDK
ncbi:MAG: hypothetical protein ORN98_03575 [Alphaproteobacteria bacterium]|nr:hypothetical protein [Alphaproteobacteria bacterium]